jgi:hypothetical protein
MDRDGLFYPPINGAVSLENNVLQGCLSLAAAVEKGAHLPLNACKTESEISPLSGISDNNKER